ncbi:hypothetical protein GOBAR_DD17231 [Gossypium barbadense]|nr:hypothetical protein GOBAR_DD17231 [Gossypium barbadense]
MDSSTVRIISECFVTPQHVSEESKQPFYLSTWDLVMLSVHYIQKGLLFTKPASGDYCEQNLINNVLVRLKRSLSITLVHFYPLAGRFATKIEQNPKSHFVCVDCNNSPGAKFIHAAVDMSVYDIVSPTYVPLVVQAFFDHDRAINYEGHRVDRWSLHRLFYEPCYCRWNHFLAFLQHIVLSEIFQAQGDTNIKISSSPVLERWFPEGNNGPLLILHFTHQDEFITRFETPHVLERILHFSAESIAKLKEKANTESNTTKSLYLHLYGAMTTAGELLEHGLGWAAWKLNQAVVNHTDKSVRGFVRDWLQSPFVYQSSPHLYPRSLIIESSPRFNMYGNEFGLGKALTLRSGYGNKFDGKISPYPGREGEGSVDIEICLPPFSMNALESDEEFMAAVSAPI